MEVMLQDQVGFTGLVDGTTNKEDDQIACALGALDNGGIVRYEGPGITRITTNEQWAAKGPGPDSDFLALDTERYLDKDGNLRDEGQDFLRSTLDIRAGSAPSTPNQSLLVSLENIPISSVVHVW